MADNQRSRQVAKLTYGSQWTTTSHRTIFPYNNDHSSKEINKPRKRASIDRAAAKRTNTGEKQDREKNEIREGNLHLRRRTNRLVETMAT